MTDATLARTTTVDPLTEDWLAVIIGFAIFAAALAGLVGPDLLGWVVTTTVWTFGRTRRTR